MHMTAFACLTMRKHTLQRVQMYIVAKQGQALLYVINRLRAISVV